MSDVMRQKYRQLSGDEKIHLEQFKDLAEQMYAMVNILGGDQRAYALARTKIEEAVMWGTKAITA